MRIKVTARLKEKQKEEIKIDTEYIKLDSFLKLAGIAESGGHAKTAIQNGEVTVNGEVCLQRGKKLRPGDTAEYEHIIYIVTQ
ncbi:MAG: RNA-binding S4 domain-containing protein [Acutalibacteraceae bacterium]